MALQQGAGQFSLTIISAVDRRNALDDTNTMMILKNMKYDVACFRKSKKSTACDIIGYQLFQSGKSDFSFLVKKSDELINRTFTVVSKDIATISFNFRHKPEVRYVIIGVYALRKSFSFHQSLVQLLSKDCNNNIKIFLGNFGSEKKLDPNLTDLVKKFNLKRGKYKNSIKLLLRDDFNNSVSVNMVKEVARITLKTPGYGPFKLDQSLVMAHKNKILLLVTWDILDNNYLDKKNAVEHALTERQVNICCLQSDIYITMVNTSKYYDYYYAESSFVAFIIHKGFKICDISYRNMNQNVAVLNFNLRTKSYTIIGIKTPNNFQDSRILRELESCIREVPMFVELYVCGNICKSSGEYENFVKRMKLEKVINENKVFNEFLARHVGDITGSTTSFNDNTGCNMLMVWCGYKHTKVLDPNTHMFNIGTWCLRKNLCDIKDNIDTLLTQHGNHHDIVCIQNTEYIDQVDIDTANFEWYHSHDSVIFYLINKRSQIVNISVKRVTEFITVLQCNFAWAQWKFNIINACISSEVRASPLFVTVGQEIQKAPAECCLFVMGNFNAICGNDLFVNDTRNITNTNSNLNGRLLLNMIKKHNLMFVSSLYPGLDSTNLSYDTMYADVSHLLIDKDSYVSVQDVTGKFFSDVEEIYKLITLTAKCRNELKYVERRCITSAFDNIAIAPTTANNKKNEKKVEIKQIFKQPEVVNKFSQIFTLATWTISGASWRTKMNLIDGTLWSRDVGICCVHADAEVGLHNIQPTEHYNYYRIRGCGMFFVVNKFMQVQNIKVELKLRGLTVLKFELNQSSYAIFHMIIPSKEESSNLFSSLQNFLTVAGTHCTMVVGNFDAVVGANDIDKASKSFGLNYISQYSDETGIKLIKLAKMTNFRLSTTFFSKATLALMTEKGTVKPHVLINSTNPIQFSYFSSLIVEGVDSTQKLITLHAEIIDAAVSMNGHVESSSQQLTSIKSEVEAFPIPTFTTFLEPLGTTNHVEQPSTSCVGVLKRKPSPSRSESWNSDLTTPPVKRFCSITKSETPPAPLLSTVLHPPKSDWINKRKNINRGGWKIASWFIPEFTGITNEIEDTLMKNNIDIACVQVNNKRYSRDNSKNYFQICGQRKYNTFPSILFLINRQTGFNLIDYIMCSSNISVLQFNHTSSKEIKVIIGMNGAKNTSSMKQLELNLIKYVKKPKIPTTVIVTGKLNEDISSSSSTSHHNLTGKLFSKFINKYKLTLHPCSIETRHIASCNVGLNCCQVNVTNLLSMIVATVVNSNEDVTATSALQTSAVTQFNQGEVARGIMKNLLTKPLPQPEPQPAFNKNGAARTMKMEVSSNEEDERVEMGEDLPSAEDSGAVSLTDNNVTLVVSELKTEETQPHQTTAITSSKPNPNCAIEQLLKAAERLNNSRCGETVEAKVVAVTKPALVLANYDLRRCYKLDMLTKILQDNNVDIACVYLTPPQTHRLGNSLNNYQLHSTSYTHVQFLVNNNLKIKTLQTKEISPSISSLTFTSDLLAYRINIFGVICLTYTQYLKHVDVFHELSNVLNSVGDDTHCILMGLFNCKIGTELIQDEQQIIGPNVHYKTSTGNIGRLMLLCRQFNLRVQTTFDSIVRDELEELFNYTQHVLVDNNSPFNIKVESVYNKQFITGLLMLKTFVYFV